MRQFHKLLLTTLFTFFAFISLANAADQIAEVPLTQAMLNNEQIISWATQAALAVNNYSYTNYQQQFETAAQQYFTKDSWGPYFNALQSSGNLHTVVAKQLTLTATTNGTPSIVQQGIIQGRYNWKVQIPITITYSNITGTTNKQDFIVTMQIERDETTPTGVSIKQFMMSK